jgi:hypothetical protein
MSAFFLLDGTAERRLVVVHLTHLSWFDLLSAVVRNER